MIERLKQQFGQSIQVLSVQEYFNERWVKYKSTALIKDQINECVSLGASIISFHATVEVKDEETGDIKIVDIHPDMRV